MRKFFSEFKKFISRGNILDLAVAVIIGGAFTAIITALTSKIITPCINGIIYACTGGKDVTSIYTFLVKIYDVNGAIDLSKSIYIDWGAFVSAIINFFLIAFILFLIVKGINKSNELLTKTTDKIQKTIPNHEEKKMLKKEGINLKDKVAVKQWLENKHRIENEKLQQEKAIAEANKPENILKEIRDLLKSQQIKKEHIDNL